MTEIELGKGGSGQDESINSFDGFIRHAGTYGGFSQLLLFKQQRSSFKMIGEEIVRVNHEPSTAQNDTQHLGSDQYVWFVPVGGGTGFDGRSQHFWRVSALRVEFDIVILVFELCANRFKGRLHLWFPAMNFILILPDIIYLIS